MKVAVFLLISVAVYAALLLPVTDYMQKRSYLAKIGHVPGPAVIKAVATDQKEFIAVCLILKVVFHSGHLLQLRHDDYVSAAEQKNTLNLLKTASMLDPYNMDSYYLAQAMVWDRQNIDQINKLLEHGMHYRTWDWYLPFFAGFNYSYFLKKYNSAARFFKRAQAVSGSNLFGRLASRYLYEGGNTGLAIAYLEAMLKSADNQTVRKAYQIRLQAMKEVKRIEDAVNKYISDKHKKPADLQTLISGGYLSPPAVDPYGGKFYLDRNSKPRTTSKFAFISGKPE